MESQARWEEFQAEFLVKLNSADFHRTLDAALANTTNASTSHHLLKTITGGKPAQRLSGAATFQRRRSKTGEELRGQITKAVLETPRRVGHGGNGADPHTPGFFMTEGPDGPDDQTVPQHSPSASPPRSHQRKKNYLKDKTVKAYNLLPLSARPEEFPQNVALRQSTATMIRVAGIEKFKPIPTQYSELRNLLGKLHHSREEQAIFFAEVDAIMKEKSSGFESDLIHVNKEKCSDGSLTREARMDRLKEICEARDERIVSARSKLIELTKARLSELSKKLEYRELKRINEQEARERFERQMCWIVMIKLAAHVNKLAPKFKEQRDGKLSEGQQKVSTEAPGDLQSSRLTRRLGRRSTQVLANKIINMWKIKKAPVQGQKYRGAVVKLRQFIKSKTSQWKNAQKTRAVDIMVLFLQEHKRANLPIVVANFIHGVKVLQRWYRNYADATHDRVRAMLMMWDDIESEWFADEELRLSVEAEKKKKIEEDFDLDSIFGNKKKNSFAARSPSSVRSRRGAESPNSVSSQASGPPSAFGVPGGSRRKHSSGLPSPNISNRKLKLNEAPMGGGGGSYRSMGGGSRSMSPRARPPPRSPRSGSHRNQSSKLNVAQTSLIIDMRLQKDLVKLRDRKPAGHVKRQLLKQKLREIRYRYKTGLPGYLEMLNRDDVAAQKFYTQKDVIALLNMKSNVFVEPKVEIVKSKRTKFPQRSKCIRLYSEFVTRGVMKTWVSEAVAEQQRIIQAKEQRLIDIAAGKAVVPLDKLASMHEENDGSDDEEKEEKAEGARGDGEGAEKDTKKEKEIKDGGGKEEDEGGGDGAVKDPGTPPAPSSTLNSPTTASRSSISKRGEKRLCSRRKNVSSISLISQLSELKGFMN